MDNDNNMVRCRGRRNRFKRGALTQNFYALNRTSTVLETSNCNESGLAIYSRVDLNEMRLPGDNQNASINSPSNAIQNMNEETISANEQDEEFNISVEI